MPDIDDPFAATDRTVIRPRPGAGNRRGSNDGPPATRHVSDFVLPERPPSLSDRIGIGLNPLVRAATPLLLLAGHLRGTLAVPDVAALRRHTREEIQRFEDRARAAGVAHEVVLAARYALCAGLDEAVLSTPWGAQSEWGQQTLLVALHREAWGGEKFFEMLDRITADPARHFDLMELQYLCIAVGFTGKYQVLERGHAHLAEVQQTLYRAIRSRRGPVPQELSLKWQGLQDRRNPLIRYVPWWVVGAAALALLAVTFTIYYTRLGNAAAPIYGQLTTIGTEAFAPRPAAPAVGPTLKQLLADDEARGNVRVDEQGNQTVITLTPAALFASGSATPNPVHGDLFGRIAKALQEVPGHVLVEGHTDDQPLQSLRYRNNFDLSRARAVSVAETLQRGRTASARFEVNGVGSTKPLYRPESTPENRARNRRVEIIHVRR